MGLEIAIGIAINLRITDNTGVPIGGNGQLLFNDPDASGLLAAVMLSI